MSKTEAFSILGSAGLRYKVLHNEAGQSAIVRKNATLMGAAEEVAGKLNGQVIFSCPNYAVVAVPNGGEVTVWMK